MGASACGTGWFKPALGGRNKTNHFPQIDLPVAQRLLCWRRAGSLRHRQPKKLMNNPIKWSIEADFLQACNCDYGCPCEFSAPPTKGFCEGTGVWKIAKGNYGGLSLDGLAVGFAAHWPKAIHEGNGTLALFIDERASKEQREAILTICSGQAGGLPFEILVNTFSKVLDPIFTPIEVKMDGRNS